MKMLKILSVVILLSPLTFAKEVNLKPVMPIDCSLDENEGRYASRSTSPKIVFENAELVEVKFYTTDGQCVDNKFKAQEFYSSPAVAVFAEGINTPWTYTPEVETGIRSTKLAGVTLKINKAKTFKKSNNVDYYLNIYPSRKINFRWKLSLNYQEGTDKTTATLK